MDNVVIMQLCTKGSLAKHKRAMHEEVKKPFVYTLVIRQLQREVLLSIKELYTKESNTLADNVVTSQLQREFLLTIKGLCMKESKTLADKVVYQAIKKEVLLSIKGLCMKELNTLVDNLIIISYSLF